MQESSIECRPEETLADAGAQLGLFSFPWHRDSFRAEIDLRVEEDLQGMYYLG